MRYDWKSSVAHAERTPAFFREIDRRFFDDVATFLPPDKLPFDALIPYGDLAEKDVLEVGTGMGSVAQQLASHAKSFTGIDLTTYATRSTRARLDGMKGTMVCQMDGERMAFQDASFDFIWSWGVIHHSSDTRRVLEEMRRVLRPGGTAVTMVYHRSLWMYFILTGLMAGISAGHLQRTGSWTKTVQRLTDGALARYYTEDDWRALVGDLFTIEKLGVLGSKTHLIPLPAGRAKDAVLAAVPTSAARFLTNQAKLGMFLVATMTRP